MSYLSSCLPAYAPPFPLAIYFIVHLSLDDPIFRVSPGPTLLPWLVSLFSVLLMILHVQGSCGWKVLKKKKILKKILVSQVFMGLTSFPHTLLSLRHQQFTQFFLPATYKFLPQASDPM